jgi:hypothetical protein
MINVKDKKCECGTIPNFNEPGETTAICCSKCKTDTMINVKDKKCECGTIPNYNEPCETTAICCSKCKTDTMINVKDKKCECGTRPNYNEPCETTAICCSKCKTHTMINVKSKKCECGKARPTFNEPGEITAICCSQCKTDTMVDVKSKKCKCGKAQPTFNEPGETTAICCSQCKTDTMVDVKHTTCKNEWCSTRIGEKYDGYCLYCYMNMFPDKPVARNYKTKEYSVVEYVKTTFSQFDWTTDKKIQDGCSRRRPDLLLDLGYQIIICEVDENQHIDYDCSCENKRIMELSQDLGHRPIVFIRFNPDDYICQSKNITSCWGLNIKGICGVKKSKKKEWDERLKVLEEQIKYWTDASNKTGKTIEVIQLFYDTE